MTNASTHTGICQACGRRQAVHINTGMIAKHGYTTEYGFFNGTCGGSDELPLELDTAVNIGTVAAMIKFAEKNEAAADAEITTVLAEVGPYYFDNYGRRKRDTKRVDRAEFEATQPSYRNFDDEVRNVRIRLRNTARGVRADAQMIDELRDVVHGQPLQERKVEADIKREYFRTYREAYARVEELKAAGHKAQQRRGGGKITVTYR
jgi:hypothetical protein